MSQSKSMDNLDFQFHTTNKPVRSLPQDNENSCKTLVMSKTNPCSVSQERCLMKSYNNSSELVPEYFWLIETALTGCGAKEQYFVKEKNITLSCVPNLSEVTLDEKHLVVVKLFGHNINLKMVFQDQFSQQNEKLVIEVVSKFDKHTFMKFGLESSLLLPEKQTTFYVFASNNSVNITWPPFDDIFSIGNIPIRKIKLMNAKKNKDSKIVATLDLAENADLEAWGTETNSLIPILFGGTFLGVLSLLGACFCCASIRSSNAKKDLQPKIDVLPMERTQESNSSDYMWEISHDNDYYHG